jgi:hypothetical protein
VDRVYLDGVIARSQALLQLLIQSMATTQETDVRYFIQQQAPTVVRALDRAHALRNALL